MTYQEFLRMVKDHILVHMRERSENYVFISKRNQNGKEIAGLAIYQPGETKAPILDLDTYYRNMVILKEMPFETLEKIAQDYKELKRDFVQDKMAENLGDSYLSKDMILPLLSTQLVNYKKNQWALEEMPHEKIEDLALIAQVEWREEGNVYYMDVTNSLAKHLAMDGDEIMKAASENNARIHPPIFMKLDDMLQKMTSEKIVFEDIPLYIMTNEENLYGACYMGDEEALMKIRETLQSDFYILPSSIHELLVMPIDCGISKQELQAIVTMINYDKVPLQEVLSNHVYQYEAETKRIKNATLAQGNYLQKGKEKRPGIR